MSFPGPVLSLGLAPMIVAPKERGRHLGAAAAGTPVDAARPVSAARRW